ncbi:hypothetical protein J7E70_27470 [Variovorax paradoxus]|nr:hypothetical protein [Variovorax paradoxus]MBT2304179.1 hypothetical protein [Variovorax paradoxus]
MARAILSAVPTNHHETILHTSFSIAMTACLTQPFVVLAQTASANESAQVRAEQRAQGAEAARTFMPGEGNPLPEATPKVPREERVKAGQARKPEGAAAAKSFRPGEGDPKPADVAKVPADQRRAERLVKRDEVGTANKAGQIPNYGDNYPKK